MAIEPAFRVCCSPGSTIHCRMEVLAPDIEGDFEIIVTLVQEGVAWFNDIDASNACSAIVKVVRADYSASVVALILACPTWANESASGRRP